MLHCVQNTCGWVICIIMLLSRDTSTARSHVSAFTLPYACDHLGEMHKIIWFPQNSLFVCWSVTWKENAILSFFDGQKMESSFMFSHTARLLNENNTFRPGAWKWWERFLFGLLPRCRRKCLAIFWVYDILHCTCAAIYVSRDQRSYWATCFGNTVVRVTNAESCHGKLNCLYTTTDLHSNDCCSSLCLKFHLLLDLLSLATGCRCSSTEYHLSGIHC